MNKTYTVDELFENIEGDADNVLLNFPPEIVKETGWRPGDMLGIIAETGPLIIRKIDHENK